MEDKSEDQPSRPSYKVEYTEVYIDKDGASGNVGKPLLRRQTPVEYSDTVPLKLPNDIQNPKDVPRFKIEDTTKQKKTLPLREESHVYENVSAHSSGTQKVC